MSAIILRQRLPALAARRQALAVGLRYNSTTPSGEKPKEVKPPLLDRIKHELHHYWDGTKLLGYEIKVSTKLLAKQMSGYELSRRESNQLKRTVGDMFRLVPFSAFLIIPFAELLLPVALKLFPNMLPSTYESKQDKEKKKVSILQTRTKTSEFLRNTFKESGMRLPSSTSKEDLAFFREFFDRLLAEDPTIPKEDVWKVARMFKNDLVLDNLNRAQLTAMSKYMNIRPFGSDNMLRYQIRHQLLSTMRDDKVIEFEGVSSLNADELYQACVSRGIRTYQVPKENLVEDLNVWLDLRLKQRVPSTLLILCSVYTYGSQAASIDNYHDALKRVLASIPDEIYDQTKLEVDGDTKLKLEVLKEEEEKIKEESQKPKRTGEDIKDDLSLDSAEKK